MSNPVVKLWGRDSTRVEPSQPKTDEGWNAGEIPPAEFFNDLFYRYTDAILFMQKNGAGEWDSTLSYKKGSIVERTGNIHKSKIDSNIGNDPALSSSNWEELGGIGNLITQGNPNRTAYNGATGSSCDTYLSSGLFAIPASSTEKPSGEAGMMLVSIKDGLVNGSQLFFSTTGKISLRYLNTGNFTNWFTMVDETRTINGKNLSNNIALTPADVGASASNHTHDKDSLGVVDFGSFGTTSTGNILFKSNETAGIAPTPAQVAKGQIAINLADGIIYTQDHNGNIISLGSLQPKAHTHQISDIVSLQSALDAKADKLPAGVENNFMSLDASGNIKDSGKNHNTYLGKSENAVSATKLKTARQIALSGGATGSASFDGSANITITVVVTNDSHTHDTRYYTKGQTDAKFNLKIDNSQKAVAGGVATLDGNIKIPITQIPDGARLQTVQFDTHQDMLDYDNSANEILMAIVLDDDGQGNGNTYIWDTNGLEWVEMATTAPVLSVNGKIGALILKTKDIAEDTNLYYTNARVNAEVRASLIKDSATDTNTLWSSSKTNTQIEKKETKFSKLSAFNKAFAKTEGTGSGTNPAYSNHTHPTTYYTKSQGDGRYAKLAGLNTQIFKVKNAVANDDAMPLGQANSLYAPISGGHSATADKWTTARKITLAGDTTGNVTLDGSANVTLTITVANDSHTHDTRYYTKTSLDTAIGAKVEKISTTNDYVLLATAGGTALKGSGQTWGDLKAEIASKVGTAGTLTAGKFVTTDASGNFLSSSYGSTSFEAKWTTTDLVNKAFGGNGTSTAVSRSDHNHNAVYAKLAGDSAVVFSVKSSTSANSAVNITTGDGRYLGKSANAVSATKLVTARTISLGGNCSGSTSFDGTANVTITVVVANDSHTHDTRYFTETESDARFLGKTAKASDSSKLNGKTVINSVTSTDTTAPASANSVKDAYDKAVSASNEGGLGYGQTWQDLLSTRAFNITYTNSTNKPIQVSVRCRYGDSENGYFIVGSVEVGGFGWTAQPQADTETISIIVPVGETYKIETSGSPFPDKWAELR